MLELISRLVDMELKLGMALNYSLVKAFKPLDGDAAGWEWVPVPLWVAPLGLGLVAGKRRDGEPVCALKCKTPLA